MSFLAGPNQKLHTDAFDAGDQRPPRWISIWSSETWKKYFSQKLKISLLQSEKSLFISLKLKKRKKTFFGQIGLEFSARHGQTVSKRIFKVESVERKSNFAYKNIFRQKYFWRKTFKLRAKDEKCTFLYTSEPSEFYPRRNQWVN